MAKTDRDVSLVDLGKVSLMDLEKDGFVLLTVPLLKLLPGDALRGKYIRKGGYEAAPDENGHVKNVNTYVVETKAGLRKVLGTTLIDNAFSEIPPGADIFMARVEDSKSKRGRTFEQYDIRWRSANGNGAAKA